MEGDREKKMSEFPKLAAVRALDGKSFAMLNTEERSVFDLFAQRGRKHGVTLAVIKTASADQLSRTRSLAEAKALLSAVCCRRDHSRDLSQRCNRAERVHAPADPLDRGSLLNVLDRAQPLQVSRGGAVPRIGAWG
jgi:hypothetical protein